MTARASRSAYFPRQVAAAACLLCFVGLTSLVLGQSKTYRPPPNYVQFGKPDQAEGRRILEDFRKRGIPGEHYLRFELRVMPRRGDGPTITGALWGGHNDRGPISRMVLSAGDPVNERRLLIQNGPHNALWNWQPGPTPTVASLGAEALFERLADTDLTAFDLQMPFLYWDDFVFEGLARALGRPAHVFLLYPPAEVAAQKPALTGVRVYLDTQFNVLVKAEQIGPEGRLLTSMTVGDVKRIDDQWLPKSVDFREEETRNKTRFVLTGAALGLDFAPTLFEPAALAEPVEPPPASQLRAVGP